MIQRPIVATFNGKHNEMKSKALITLLDHKEKELPSLTLKQLAFESSVSYEYLKSRLGKWHEWGYVKRRVTNGSTRPVYSYSIAERGRHFIEDIIPDQTYIRYVEEIKEARRQRITSRPRFRLSDLLKR